MEHAYLVGPGPDPVLPLARDVRRGGGVREDLDVFRARWERDSDRWRGVEVGQHAHFAEVWLADDGTFRWRHWGGAAGWASELYAARMMAEGAEVFWKRARRMAS